MNIKDLLIEIINKTEGCTISQLIEILYTKEEYTKELLESKEIINFIEKSSEKQILKLSEILNNIVQNNEIECLSYSIPKDSTTRSFLMPKYSKLIAINNNSINKKESRSTDINIGIGLSLLYIFMITAWVFGIALSDNTIDLILSVLIPPFSWVIAAQWIIGLIG